MCFSRRFLGVNIIFSTKSIPFFIIGGSILSSKLFKKSANCEESQAVEAKTEPPNFLSNFEELTDGNFDEIMNNNENKFIFYYEPGKVSSEYLQKVNNHASKMKAGLEGAPYVVNMEKQGKQFLDYLKTRNMSEELEGQINDNNFILANKHDDIWFWDDSLITYFQGELLEQVFNFYQGVRVLHDEHELMITMTENDNHFVTYCSELNKDTNKRAQTNT